MEFVEGQSLKDQVSSNQLSVISAIEIAIQIAEGLQAAHEKKITHRDIKPANVMITPKGQVKIMDFGLAKLAGRSALTKEGTTLGTVAYMSPEQARGEVVDHRTDIWAFGVVLYEMITGQHPFKGEYEQAVMYSIMHEEPEPITGLRTGVPMELERIVNKAMAKNSATRYQHADELLVDLLVAGKNIEAKSSGTKPRSAAAKSGLPKRAYLFIGLAIFLVGLIVAGLWLFDRGNPIDSLAVLPFVNVGADPNTEYLSDGITETLIYSLSRLPELKVMSLTSVSRYKGQEPDALKVGRELKVKAVLTGRLVQRGDNLSISAELVNAQDNSHIWGEQYTHKMAEILALQAELAKEILDKLRLRLSGEEMQRLSRSYGEDTEAYQAYLKGRYYAAKATNEEGFRKAVKYFNQAIAKAPNYALAYVGLAEAYYEVSSIYLPPKEAMPLMKEAALKAMEIDNTLAEAHAMLAKVKDAYDWDWSGAEAGYKRAIALNPNNETAHLYYGGYLVGQGRFEEGLTQVKIAQEIDPLSVRISNNYAYRLILARRYDQAIEQGRNAIELDANSWIAHDFLGQAYLYKGQLPEALAEFQKVRQLDDSPWTLVNSSRAFVAAGMRTEALKMLAELHEHSKRGFVSTYGIACVYAALGENEPALTWLEKAYADRDENLGGMKVNPRLDSLRSNPRFNVLLKKMGLWE